MIRQRTYDSINWMFTRSNLEKPSDSTAPPWVASVSIDPEMSKTQIMEIGCLFSGAEGEVIFMLIARSPSIMVD